MGGTAVPHHAAELNHQLTNLAHAPLTNPCAELSSRQAQGQHDHSLSGQTYQRIVDWMRSRIDEPITEDMICARFLMGKFAFRNAFAAHAGMAPMNYLTWLRVDMAVRLLVDTRFDLDEIAFVTGLKEEKGLIAAFVRTLGVRPHALRASAA
ncbi:AraC family transcriptional regulator [Tateyamaria omphalii]|uniref:helix-turn-helix domain-containing protein n=1 Tax=Tateyamaria omphalii TaxID=299262 RepID=UPI001C9A1CC6|nr:AraC family transcriptional regulator [Tateyamaria omphalii]MBY5932372.1 AraC family transcriptional regulator [Tateyamaria omphalii]